MLQGDGILDRISSLASELKLANLQPQIAACGELLQRCDGIEVAVFGRFKAGKSSFLNHLAGRDVLPVGVVPLTAVITRLRYGSVERAEVRFQNGTTRPIPLADIALYVAEQANPDNRQQVAAVEVELPALESLAPLEFVDTPGLGSAFTHNTEAALKWLPHVGAALVALSSDAALSERDLALLDELRRHTPKIVLLLTKADLLTGAQRAEVLSFVQGQVRRRLNCDLAVFFYSVLPSLVALKAELRERLLNPLLRDRADASRQILRHKLASLREQTLSYLRVSLAVATQAESAWQALRERLDEERRQFGLLRQELQVLTREWSAKALEQSLERLQPTERALRAKVTREMQIQFPQWRLRLPMLLQAWRDWLQSFLACELSEVSRSQQPMFCEPAQKAGAHLARTVRAFQDRLAEHVRAGLDVTMSPREFNPEVPEPSAPPVDVRYAFDAAFSAVGWVIPLTLFRRPIERVLLRKARYEVQKNLSRLAAGWQERVGIVIEELRRQAEEAALNELDALTRMLEQTTSSVPGLRQQIAELERMPIE